MDRQTIDAYDARSAEFSSRYRSLRPIALHDVVKGFFYRGTDTADIGCGSGRDVAWLASEGFRPVGYDASAGMLAAARAAYPDQSFVESALPNLKEVPSERFQNVLCSAVLMHLPRSEMISALFSLARILKPGGRMILSLRQSRSVDDREDDGRLYTEIAAGKLVLLLESVGFRIAATTKQPDASRIDVEWTTVVAEKGPLDHARGLERIQSILVQDAKTATYKPALIRAFCEISRTESNLVHWAHDGAYIPMLPVAVHWLTYYWLLLTAPTFFAQKHGETPECRQPIAFRRDIQSLSREYPGQNLWPLLSDIETQPERFEGALQKIASTIRQGPVAHSGSIHSPVFRFAANLPDVTLQPTHGGMGWIFVPESIWLDISRFDQWIEHSVIVRWAELSVRMNPGRNLNEVLPYIMSSTVAERGTNVVRNMLLNSQRPLECVWSGRVVDRRMHIDHAIPFAAWGNNDFWNMLPCHGQVNLQKSDAVPAPSLIRERSDCIVSYWRFYRERFESRFDLQISRALGCRPEHDGWEREALTGFQETVQRISATRGLAVWQPRDFPGSPNDAPRS